MYLTKRAVTWYNQKTVDLAGWAAVSLRCSGEMLLANVGKFYLKLLSKVRLRGKV
jgi:hypothetical protein